jgi:predicted DNA-binding protein with PD1-like motif
VKTQLLGQTGPHRTFAVVLEAGDEVMSCLSDFAREVHLDAAEITGVGAFSDASLQYFCWKTKRYVEIPVPQDVEVAALVGDLELTAQGTPTAHLHVLLGASDGAAMAGQLSKAHVRPSLEVIVTESSAFGETRCFDLKNVAPSRRAA